MKKLLKDILDCVLEYIKENKIFICIITGFIILFLIMFSYVHNLKSELDISRINIKAATEKIDSLRLSNGELLYEKQSYITSIDELENYLDISKKEVKSLQKSLNDKIQYIGILEGKLEVEPDSGTTTITKEFPDTVFVIKDTTFEFEAYFREKWYEVICKSYFEKNSVKAELCRLSVDIPLKVGLTDEWKIFVITENPYVHFSDIDGALIDKKQYLKSANKPKIKVGLQLGFGGNYGILHKSFDYGPYVGVGLSYNFGL